VPCHAESDSECRERDRAVEELRTRIQEGKDAEEALWQAVLAYQNYPLHTSSGLPFSYTVKCNKKGEYSGELLVSRKEGSKTLTKSSIMLAFRIVLEEIETKPALVFPEYKGPKAIGQIFGISYVYSLFWRLGLIRVPEKVEAKLNSR
jgi:hypothetical protein